MRLRLVREPSRNGATLGVLFVDGRYECFTLEDVIREQPGVPVSIWKVAGRTAIPAGRYRVVITESARFLRKLPLLVDVPGFTGIRIHPGNGPVETEGCLLVGWERADGSILRSRAAFEALFERLTAATGDIAIEIENPRAVDLAAA